jgi:chlorophyll synthase
VQLGPRRAARFACWIMALPQIVILGAMISWGLMFHAALIGALVIGQILAMQKLLKDPEKYAPWYNATGVSMFVFGMMICAVGLRGLAAL